MRKYSKYLAAAVAVGLFSELAISQAAIQIDLVATSGSGITITDGGKTISYTGTGGTFNFDIYALVTGASGNNALEGVQIVQGSLSTGGAGTVQVNLTHALNGNFTASGANAGTPTNLGGDSDTDIGISLTPLNNTAGNIVYRSSSMYTTGSTGAGTSSFLLGSGTGTISATGTNTILTFNVGTTNGTDRAPTWQEDGAVRNRTNGTVLATSGIAINQLITTTSTTYDLSASAGSVNVLLGGSTSLSSTITNVGSGNNDTLNFTGLNASSGAGGSVTGAGTNGGPLALNGGSATNNGLAFTGTGYGNVTVTPTITTATNATLNTAATAGATSTVIINVGNATTGPGNTFGTALSGLAGVSGELASKTTATEAIAELVDNGSSMSMAWRDATVGEPFVQGDVVRITTNDPNVYVLKMTYTSDVDENSFFLGEYAGDWTNAGFGTKLGAWSGQNTLGQWGIDTAGTGGYVWAVVNGGGDFAVIPEPTSLALLGLGAAGLLARRKKA